MMAFWISLAVAVTLLLIWRLRRAAALLDRILAEERAITERQNNPVDHPKR